MASHVALDHRRLDPRRVRPLGADVVAEIAALLGAADHVLVAAGAGMSVDAGHDYDDEASFVARYPVVARLGLRCRYHTFGYPWPSEAVQWGWIARHLEETRFSPPPDPSPYEHLRELTAKHDRFVLTSNADDLFERTGFDRDRIFTRQGSYARLQCLAPCSDATWSSEAWYREARPAIDLATETITDPARIPRCPRCGGAVMLNVRGGDWFVEAPYEPQAERFGAWLAGAARGRLVVLDVGTGYNTPGVVRWPAERIVADHPRAHLVRVNLRHPATPLALGDRGLGVASTGLALWRALAARRA
jgi:NAD-dependent SIR2 family protein deacetylase